MVAGAGYIVLKAARPRNFFLRKKNQPAPAKQAKAIPDSRPKWAESVPVFSPKRPKYYTLWGGTYLYGLYKGVPLPPPPNMLETNIGQLGGKGY